MEFCTWREMMSAYVSITARAEGWIVERVKVSKSSGSWYVVLRFGRKRAEIRLSDHAPRVGTGRRSALLSVHRAVTGRVAALQAFLAARVAT